MRLLLDTHTFLWFITDNPQLSSTAKTLIETPDNDRVLSMGSVWEMAIKLSLGKLTITQPFDIFLSHQLEINGIELLHIELAHITAILNLPLHHRDPFDRLIIAQSLVEQIPLLSADSTFDHYPIQRLW